MIVIVIVLLHVAVILGLIRAFAPELTASVVRNVTSAFTVTVTATKPPSYSDAHATPRPSEGAAAEAGRGRSPRKEGAAQRGQRTASQNRAS